MDETRNIDPNQDREQQLAASREAWQRKTIERREQQQEIATRAHDLALAEMTRTTPPQQ